MILVMALTPFKNEDPADFVLKETLEDFDQALRLAAPLFLQARRDLSPLGIEEARAAVESAKAACLDWSRLPVEERAAILVRAAAILRKRKFELAACLLLEVRKSRPEADADVCEAIDFLEYYAREAVRIGQEGLPMKPLGVVAVIAPWNFPLAILAGMTAAALVTGNAVLMKPAEQSPVIARRLFEILREAGVPEGGLHFLPGQGEVVGDFLVRSPDVALVAFTGSKEVGERIAGIRAKGGGALPIMEIGGKNAIIIDETADLDQAAEQAKLSAFGFQGQKCSACSRILLLPKVYVPFQERFLETVSKIRVGPPEDTANFMGPVIDEEAFQKISRMIEIGEHEARLLYRGNPPTPPFVKGGQGGFFIAPTIFGDVKPEAKTATEEIFGPVVCLMKARNLDEALKIAHHVPYDLTGGFFSSDPANIQRVRKDFEVGNLYINRKITGALVACQPFGGYRRSSLGFKAGGPEYLYQFLESPKMPEPPPYRKLLSASFQEKDQNELLYIKEGKRWLGKTISQRIPAQ